MPRHIKDILNEDVYKRQTYEDAAALCKRVLKAFTDGQVGEIYLAYTHFKNTVTPVSYTHLAVML